MRRTAPRKYKTMNLPAANGYQSVISKKDNGDKSSRYGLFEYQPGNCTKYTISILPVGDDVIVGWLYTSGVAGPSFLINELFRISPSVSYFMDKTGIGREDTRVIMDFLVIKGIIPQY